MCSINDEGLLGPFFFLDGAEFIPVGFEESIDRIAETLGTYCVRSNVNELVSEFTVTPEMLTEYIQEDWYRIERSQSSDEDPMPRSGFLLSSRSASHAAGRAAEEVILLNLLSNLVLNGSSVVSAMRFWDAVDQDMIARPKGSASDDLVLVLQNGETVIVEAKSSFGKGSVNRYCRKAISQLVATVRHNPSASTAILALLDYKMKQIAITFMGRRQILESTEEAFSALVRVDQ